MRILTIFFTLIILIACGGSGDDANTPIKIGEINSYTKNPLYTTPYQKGWELAVREVNQNGGLLGRQVEVLVRDDDGKPPEAIKKAHELMARDEVDLLTGCFYSNICLALGNFAEQNKKFVMRWYNSYPDETTRESAYAFATMAGWTPARALANHVSDLGIQKWSSVAFNYAYGQLLVQAFKAQMAENTPSVEFVSEYWPALNKLDAGATVGALLRDNPEGIFNGTFGGNFSAFVREGKKRGLDDGRVIVSNETGIPEYLRVLGSETPEGWIMTGYPRKSINTSEHQRFVGAYQALHNDELPDWMSLIGYVTYNFMFEAVKKAGTTKNEAVIQAMRGLEIETPLGPVTMRARDHLATLGMHVGKTAIVDGEARLVDWTFYDGADLLINERKVKP